MLKPLAAVQTQTLGNCGCHRNSFGSCWPMCKKSNCAGKCDSPGASSVPSGLSSSTAMSQIETELSSEATASTVSSVGCQSTEVTGFLCHTKLAMAPASTCRVSQILKPPSSDPVTISSPTHALQLKTFTSPVWASLMSTAGFVREFSRMSQTRTQRSEPHEANVALQLAPAFFHCTSSTEPSCAAKGFSAPTVQPPCTGSQRSASPPLPPERKRPVSCGLKSRANPSCLCASLVKIGFTLNGAFSEALSRARRWACKFHMWTLPVSAHVATMCGACGIDLILFTPPGCAAPWCSNNASCSSSLSSSLSSSSPSSWSLSMPSFFVLYSLDHFIMYMRLSAVALAWVPATT
mmetsp:Transcript_21542/g.43418  ORF Transcript_21542/g.43418 Transcript_21542/m.43418 type:complete len:350 (+) Transcript_21542:94-1143(+)